MFDNAWNAWKSTILWEGRYYGLLFVKATYCFPFKTMSRMAYMSAIRLAARIFLTSDSRSRYPWSGVWCINAFISSAASDKVDVKSCFSHPKQNAILSSAHFQFHNNDHHRWVCNYRRFKGWWNLMMRFFSISSVLQSESPELRLRRKEQSDFDLVQKLEKEHEKIESLRGFSTAHPYCCCENLQWILYF